MSTTAGDVVAYALTAEATADGEYLGGILNVDGADFDVKAALDEGDGTIVTSDPATITILDSRDELERTAPPVAAIEEILEQSTKADLETYAASIGYEPSASSKGDLVEELAAELAERSKAGPALDREPTDEEQAAARENTTKRNADVAPTGGDLASEELEVEPEELEPDPLAETDAPTDSTSAATTDDQGDAGA